MKNKLRKIQEIMAAAAFAEEGDFDTALELLRKNENKRGGSSKRKISGSNYSIKRIKQGVAAFVKKHGKIAEAITFAEAGEHEYAKILAGEVFRKKPQILVVGEHNGFSETLVKYAVGMAERLSYDIVALSVLTPPGKGHNEELETDVYSEALTSADIFNNKLASISIGFQHVIKFGDLHRTIKTTYQEMARVAYVLMPPGSSALGGDILNNIPVFSVMPITPSQ
ncbi:hypothetical protein ACFL6N_01885 [Thermodesulfobacteriota bacterium]